MRWLKSRLPSTRPTDKLQAGKKYVIEASIDGQEQSEVTEYITVNP